MKTWSNGERAEVVKKIIEDNFKIVSKHLSHNILSLTSDERIVLTEDYLSDGLIVFDTTLKRWLQYHNGNWIPYGLGNGFEITVSKSDWNNGKITIPYETHLISSPIVQMYLLDNLKYLLVFGGVDIDESFNVTLKTDLPFDGKVVIK